MAYVSHLEAAIDGTQLPHDRPQTTHQGRPLWVRYDLDRIAKQVNPGDLQRRPPVLWRYLELLPITESDIVSLGESVSPILPVNDLAAHLGLSDLWIKDESRLPTSSFKSRGMAMAVGMARSFGIRRLAAPTAGNAGGSLAAYCARAGIEATIFMPKDTPAGIQRECIDFGANTFLVDGLISDCGRIVREGRQHADWFDVATLREPYRIEGKKTMGLELAEQLDWHLPDAVLYQTGGGTGLLGMWKAFNELAQLGWLKSDTMPRMIAVQSDGCAPIVRAYERGDRFADVWESPNTNAWGIRVPAAIGDFMILDAIRESNGLAIEVPDADIEPMRQVASSLSGLDIAPETAACFVAASHLVSRELLAPDDRVVVFNTCAGMKYGNEHDLELRILNKEPGCIDYQSLNAPTR